jgi:uncharacterized phage protein gp47/JayE
MAFVPRSFTTILTDMIAYVQTRSNVSDFNPGSVVRTVLEAAALEDDEQYFQMVQILDLFSYTTAAGEDLDRRLADFNIFREPSKSSFGRVAFFNGNLIYDQLQQDAVAGTTSLSVFDSNGFPTSGFPYTIRVSEGTTHVQDYSVLALNTGSNTFTLSIPTVSDVFVGERVSLVTGASIQSLPVGTDVQAPPTSVEEQKIYRTQEIATIAAGNFYSNEVIANSADTGTIGNVGSNRITQFVGSPPFSGAGVTNFAAMEGGVSRETDEDLRARAIEKLQSLSRGTVLSLKAESVGVIDSATGQRVISSNVLEDWAGDPDEVIVYIDDGTGLIADVVSLAQSTVGAGAAAPSTTITLTDASAFPSTGTVLVDTSPAFLVEYVSVSGDVLTLAPGVTTPTTTVGGEIVRRVNIVSTSTEQGQRRFTLQNPPIVRGTDRIWIKELLGTDWTLLTANIDYVLNKGTGEFSIVDAAGLGLGTQVIAFYNYYTNLIAEAQKVLEGDSNDSVNYPGVKAAGIFLAVEAPTSKRVTVEVAISAETTFVETDLAPLVQSEIENYVRSLKIGEDVIVSRIVDAIHDVQGVRSVNVALPSSDVIVLENELPSPFDASGNSLVTVL